MSAAAPAPTVIVSETMILPTGMATDDMNRHAHALFVRWQGDLGWTVSTTFRDERLSVKGRRWESCVPRRNRRHYYFPTRAAAIEAAIAEVDRFKVNGRTFAEWEASR